MKFIIKISLCFFSLIGILHAQSLDEFLDIASENNLELKALSQEYLSALEKAPQVSELPDPQVGLGAFVLPVETRLGPQYVRVGASQMFPWKGTLKAREDVVLTMARAKYERIAATRLNLEYTVKKAYYQLYELVQSQSIVVANLRIFNALERFVLAKVESGKASTADVLRVQIKLQELEKELAILKNQIKDPLASLNQILNRPIDASVTILDSLTLAFIPYDKDTLGASIQSNHPMIKLYSAQQLVAQKEIELNLLNGKPSFGIGLDYILVGERTDANPVNNGRDILLPRASIKIPIYRKKYGAKKREEELKIAAFENRKFDLQLKFLSKIEQAYTSHKDAELKLKLYDELKNTTEATISILETSYSTSGNNFDELLRLQSELVNYDLKILKAIVKSHIAKASIERFIEI